MKNAFLCKQVKNNEHEMALFIIADVCFTIFRKLIIRPV